MHCEKVRTVVDPHIQGIVFDAVGTLIHPHPSVADAYTAAARRQGVDLERGEVKTRFLRHFGDDEVDDDPRGPLATSEATEVRRWRRIVSAVLPEVTDQSRAFAELWDHFGRSDSWRPDPDAAAMIESLREAGLRIGIGSNFDSRLRGVLRGIPALKLADDPILISSEVGFRKPHPRFYQAACASLDLRPSRILWVGDDLENDYRGPLRAGFQAILLSGEESREDSTVRRVKTLGAIHPSEASKRSAQ